MHPLFSERGVNWVYFHDKRFNTRMSQKGKKSSAKGIINYDDDQTFGRRSWILVVVITSNLVQDIIIPGRFFTSNPLPLSNQDHVCPKIN